MNDEAVRRIRQRLQKQGLAGYVAITPSNIFYVTGFRSYFVSEWWRMHGTVFAVVPADEAKPVLLVVGDFEEKPAREAATGVALRTYRLWVDLSTAAEMATPPGEPLDVRPEQWDPAELLSCLGGALTEGGLTSHAVGTDLRFATMGTFQLFQAAAPSVTWREWTDDMYTLRLIKQEWEVERLRAGVLLSQAGMTYAAEHASDGMTAADIRAAYQIGVVSRAQTDPAYRGYTDNWVLPTVGGITSADYGSARGGLEPGQLVKFDCGTTVGGYRCDGGRTFSYRIITSEAARLYGVLAEAQEIARSMMRPGTVIGDVYRAAMRHVHENGYPSYNRGHVGHSVGIDSFHEEPPYLSPGCSEVVAEGSVFAVELPTYTPDVGAIMIEDMLVVRSDGPELLHTMTHDLVVL